MLTDAQRAALTARVRRGRSGQPGRAHRPAAGRAGRPARLLRPGAALVPGPVRARPVHLQPALPGGHPRAAGHRRAGPGDGRADRPARGAAHPAGGGRATATRCRSSTRPRPGPDRSVRRLDYAGPDGAGGPTAAARAGRQRAAESVRAIAGTAAADAPGPAGRPGARAAHHRAPLRVRRLVGRGADARPGRAVPGRGHRRAVWPGRAAGAVRRLRGVGAGAARRAGGRGAGGVVAAGAGRRADAAAGY